MALLIIVLLLLFKFLFCHGLVSGWGEVCSNTQDCNDHRYICKIDENDNIKKCLCDRFHEWRGYTMGCIPKYNSTTILQMVTGNSFLSEEERDRAIGSAFIIQWVAGIFVFITVLLAAFSVIVYCWYIRMRDRALRMEIQMLINKKNRNTAGTSAEV